MIQKIQKIIGICAIVGVLSFLVYSVSIKADVVSAQNTVTPQQASSTLVGRDIIDLMDTFQSVSIDSSLFSSPLFQNLKDFSSIIQPEVPGRSNPFAPINSVNNNQVTNSASPVKTLPKNIKITR